MTFEAFTVIVGRLAMVGFPLSTKSEVLEQYYRLSQFRQSGFQRRIEDAVYWIGEESDSDIAESGLFVVDSRQELAEIGARRFAERWIKWGRFDDRE